MQRAQLAAHDIAEFRVQRAQRLVEQKRQRLAHDGPAERHALAVAARQARNRAIQQMRDPQRARRLVDTALHLAAQHPLRPERIGDIRAHVHVRVEREQLEHERNVALRCALERHVLAAQQDAAGRRQFEPGDHAQRGGLAAAGGPEQAEEVAVGHGERGVAHGGERPERFVQILDADLGHPQFPLSSSQFPISLGEFRHDGEQHRAGQRGEEGPRIQRQARRAGAA